MRTHYVLSNGNYAILYRIFYFLHKLKSYLQITFGCAVFFRTYCSITKRSKSSSIRPRLSSSVSLFQEAFASFSPNYVHINIFTSHHLFPCLFRIFQSYLLFFFSSFYNEFWQIPWLTNDDVVASGIYF